MNKALTQWAIPVKTLSALLFLGLLGWQTQQWMAKSSTMPIKKVRVEGGLKYIDQESVVKAVGELVQTGYFAIDKATIINKLTALEWVQYASIRRIWPDTIAISIHEQNPVAVWNKTYLLNNKAEPFRVELTQGLKELPHLSGKNSDSERVLSVMGKTNDSIADLGLTVQMLNLADHGSWALKLNNGLTFKAGQQSPEKSVSKSIRVLAALDKQLLERAREIDMRYPNGIAIAWKKTTGLTGKSTKPTFNSTKQHQPLKG
ncbi:MAG: FtsQ-type POTRA domain-containing protein [Cycloclasticus sp.]|nr:FtsQ-type POTRA domain-containing protein [Cycloclasticus sp.]MBQ0790535.1 FtsQ-type POTRA domain-containing protein [Cycloclasticus sp.]